MQHLLSKGLGLGGLGASARTAAAPTHVGPGNLASGARSLHVHVPRLGAPIPPSPALQSNVVVRNASTTAARILNITRTAITRFFAHVATPGFSHPIAEGFGTTISARANLAARPPSIQSRMSLSARHALSQPKAPFLPRPSPAGRSITQVGFGTARNFSTTRPIFQHLVENVPVAGRTLYEADWDVRKKTMKDKFRMKAKSRKQGKNTSRRSPFKSSNLSTSSSFTQDLELYFPSEKPAVSNTTTVLLVPLAPSPTSRLPLTERPSCVEPHLLVFSDIRDVLSSHRKHSLRVSSLFARLDVAHVWEKGASFSAQGDANGLCTVLRVDFKGWSEAMVMDVLGDAGRGWCKVVEMREAEEESDMVSDTESGMSSLLSSRASPLHSGLRSPEPHFDPAASFVLPTLDFSSSFIASSESIVTYPPSPPLSPPESRFSDASPPLSDYGMGDEDSFSDVSSESWADAISVSTSSSGSLMAFSSAFLAHAEDVEFVELGRSSPSSGPREELFF